ncbi:MAG: Flagellar hook-associated protein [Holophagaceae bacterium]|nr:Flagellar hook-associated protein [Holophagaceae bacterium]
MPGLNASLFLGLSGLQAQQSALNVVGHNIANVNTPGYSRQRADLTANQALIQGQVYFGTGVTLNAVQGLRDRFLDLQIYRETSRQEGASERYTGIEAVSTSLGDTTSSGIAAQIQAFFQGFQELSARPEDSALRTNLIGKANTMISGMQARYRMLNDQRDNANQAVTSLVTEVNTLTKQIADLNREITGELVPGSNNDARDQRKSLTDKLSTLVGISVFEGSHGEYQITLDSGLAVLVSGQTSFDLKATPDATLDNNYYRVDSLMGTTTVNVTADIRDGQLGGKLDLRDRILVDFQQQLDTLAAGLASQVNLQHRAGFDLNGVAGQDFFLSGVANGANGIPALMTAANAYKGMVNALTVNAAVAGNPKLIAAGGIAAAGDNANAKRLANLQLDGGVNAAGVVLGASYSSVVGTLINDVGTTAQTWEAQTTAQENLVSALQAQRDRLSGVDLDEEAANMMILQRGYQASARFLSVINQLTDQLVNEFGK